jgi:hypothetical protein
VPRSTFYYRPPVFAAPRVPVVDEVLATQIRTILDAEPVAGLTDDHGPDTPKVRGAREPQQNPSDSEAERLASPPTATEAKDDA